jgi:hypothetical protein
VTFQIGIYFFEFGRPNGETFTDITRHLEPPIAQSIRCLPLQ